MNINSIKRRADELVAMCKPQYVRVLLIMMVIGLIPSVFPSEGNTAIIAFILTVIFTPFSHGYVVSSLKIVRNNYQALEDKDAWSGIVRFKELFFTYFLFELVVFGVVLALTFVMMLFAIVLGISFESVNGTFVFVFLLTFVVMLTVIILLSLFGFAFPYLLEQYGYYGMEAIKESFAFIKGHLVDLLKLEFSYFGWILLVVVVQGVLGAVLSFAPSLGSLVAALVAGVVSVYTYMPQYYLAKAIFFEEIAYQRYETKVYDAQNTVETETVEDMNNQGEDHVY